MNDATARVTPFSPARCMWPVASIGALIAMPTPCVSSRATLLEVAETMRRERVSAVLVDGGAAMVTERDLVRAFEVGASTDDVVDDVATWQPLRVPGDVSVTDATALMLNADVDHLVVDLPGSTGVVALRNVAAVLLQAVDPHLWLTSMRVAIHIPGTWWG